MPTSSNLYAEKILSEHPLAMWSLDDTSDYVSIISESFRNINAWTISNGTKASSSSTSSPFSNSYTTQITGANTAGTTVLTSASTFSSDSDGFTVSFYIKTSTNVDIQVGYTGTTQTQTIKGASYPQDTWIPVSFTFSSQATNKNLIINLIYLVNSPVYYINGLTIGKNSEPFNGESLGQTLITIPTNIATTQTSGIEAKSYGTQEYSAYYIGSGNNLFAKNAGMSLSYGSDSSMIIYPHTTSGQPSFIFPGFGFLNDDGRYKELTLEFLIRINAINSIPKRIIGPLASTDGVYVTKEFISLKVGDAIESFYLSELYKPLVLQLRIGENYAILNIDGEDLIDLTFDSSTLSLPAKINGSSKNQDWIGLFAYSDVPFFEVDSIAIYPYRSSDVISKRKLAYAQGVEVPLNTNVKYGGSSILADFSFANYVNNYNYPSFQAKWSQAFILDNVDIINEQTLSTKSYNAPTLFTNLYDSDILLKDIYETNIASGETNTFINLKPSTVVSGSGRSWTGNYSYLYVTSFNHTEHLSNCVYGIFKSLETSPTEQTLFKILDESTGNSIKVSIKNTTISYILKYNNVESTIYSESITQGTMFAIGLDIQELINRDNKVSLLFANKNKLNIYVGGALNENTFSGNIYKIGLCSLKNFKDIANLFTYGILTSSTSYSTLLSRIATYTVVANKLYNKIILDISTNCYWQDYVPLSKLAKTVYDVSGNQTIDLDFIQLDFDYPEPKVYSSGNFDTSNSLVKTYISFQKLSDGVYKTSSDFSTTVSANENRVIDASTYSNNTKYEFVSGMIVYPPKDIDFTTLAIVMHIEIYSDANNLKPINIRHLQLAAQSFNANNKNAIGTRYNVNLYPYKFSSGVYSYKDKVPFLIYKQSTPYLYLTKYTGVRVCGTYDGSVDKGMYAEVGNASLSIKINSIQTSILADIKEFPTTGMKLFSIDGNASTLTFYVKAANSAKTKGMIYTDSSDNIAIYYLNGKLVANPIINLNEWNIVGITLINPIDLSNNIGKFKIYSNILLDNISYYGLSTTEINQKTTSKLWSETDNGNWNAVGTWQYLSPYNYYKFYNNNLKDIYKIYTGTNKKVTETYSDSQKLMFNGYEYIAYMDVKTNTITLDIV